MKVKRNHATNKRHFRNIRNNNRTKNVPQKDSFLLLCVGRGDVREHLTRADARILSLLQGNGIITK